MKIKEQRKKVVFILGPTAIGKTSLSIALAKYFNTEIISFDSRQLYKELSIGTAAPKEKEQKKITHHFIQNISIFEEFNIGIFEKRAIRLINNIHKKKNIIIAVGGSGLYMSAICNGIDKIPEVSKITRQKINKEFKEKGLSWLQNEVKKTDPVFFIDCDKNNPQRLIRALEVYKETNIPISYFRKKTKINRTFDIIKIGINTKREELYERINNRVDEMIKEGLLEEVRKLLPFQHLNALQTIGYKELFLFYKHKNNLAKTVEDIKMNTRRFAKRQLTWFNKDKEIVWFNPNEEEKIIKFIGL